MEERELLEELKQTNDAIAREKERSFGAVVTNAAEKIAQVPTKPIQPLKIEIGSDIDLEDLQEIDFIINDLLTLGLSILAADPKAGKSWFALLMCLCVSQGKKFLKYDTNKCTCLYLALEDSDNRMKHRISKLYHGEKLPSTFAYTIEANDLSNGLIEQLEIAYKSMTSLRFIVIDTLQCIRGQYNNKDGGAYGYDYKEMNTLKKFAKSHNLAILVIHHSNKAGGLDPFSSISGTRGITGAMDLMMVIKKDETMAKNQAYLHIRGRDIGDDSYVIKMEDGYWSQFGSIEEVERMAAEKKYRKDPIVKTIKKLLEKNGEWKGKMKDLLQAGEEQHYLLANSAQSLQNKVMKLKKDLEEFDGINILEIKKGTGSKVYCINYGAIPFHEPEQEVLEL